MVEKLLAKCPRCGAEIEVKRSMRWRLSVEGNCSACGIHFTTPTFWEKK
ncbi:MAG: zinc ribbon domain-containing protein [Candidatus Freyarchaeum deiterrae]